MLSKEKINEWKNAKLLLDKYKKLEGKMRKEIVSEINKMSANPKTISDNISIEKGDKSTKFYGYGFGLKVVNKKSISVDESINDDYESLSEEEQDCFERKLQFYPGKWNALKEQDEDVVYDLEDYLTEKPATPTLELIPIDED